MGFAVKVDKGDFIGKDVLQKQKEEGAKRKLQGFEITGKGIARTGYEVFDKEGSQVGVVTSGTQSPATKRSIGFAMVDTDFHELEKSSSSKSVTKTLMLNSLKHHSTKTN